MHGGKAAGILWGEETRKGAGGMEQKGWPAVTVLRLADYDRERTEAAVERLFCSWPGAASLRRETKVTIKPNLLMARSPDQATTTHPAVVAAVAAALRRRGVEQITVADSPGGPYTAAALRRIYRACGMEELCGVTLNLDTAWGSRKAKPGSLAEEFHLIRPILEADVVISVGKLKTHGMTTLSGGVKNLFGCVPGLQKPELHYRYPTLDAFSQMLLDLAETVAPAFTIVDAVSAMEGNGPSGGTPRQVGLLAGSTSPFALDLVLADLIGLGVEDVATLRHSLQRGLIPGSAAQLQTDGDPYEKIADFRMPASKALDFSSHMPGPVRPLVRWLRRRVTPRPVIRRERCVGCGKCAESCPAHTIAVKEGKAVIDYRRCISCFCCHEMCPVRAIEMGRKWGRGRAED